MEPPRKQSGRKSLKSIPTETRRAGERKSIPFKAILRSDRISVQAGPIFLKAKILGGIFRMKARAVFSCGGKTKQDGFGGIELVRWEE